MLSMLFFQKLKYKDISYIKSVILQNLFFYKDLKPFMADLKPVYKADTKDLALEALADLEENWEKKYHASIASRSNSWLQFSTYFKYPSEIRKLIYTTNSIEN